MKRPSDEGMLKLAGDIIADAVRDLLVDVEEQQRIANELSANRSSALAFLCSKDNWFSKMGYDLQWLVSHFPDAKQADVNRAMKYIDAYGKMPKVGKRMPPQEIIPVLAYIIPQNQKHKIALKDAIAYLRDINANILLLNEEIDLLARKLENAKRRNAKLSKLNTDLKEKMKKYESISKVECHK